MLRRRKENKELPESYNQLSELIYVFCFKPERIGNKREGPSVFRCLAYTTGSWLCGCSPRPVVQPVCTIRSSSRVCASDS